MSFGDYCPSYLGMPGGGAGAGDVTIAVADFLTGTSETAESFTSATIIGLTPAAVLVLGANHEPANDPGETALFSLSTGLVSVSEDYQTGLWERENSASTDNATLGELQSVYQIMDNSGSGFKTAEGQTIPGGVELEFNINGSSSLRGAFVAFAGSDTSAAVHAVPMDGSGVGFEPDVVIAIGPCHNYLAVGGGLVAGLRYSFGITVNDGSETQRCVMWAEADALTSSAPFQQLRNDCVGGQLSATTGAPDYKLVVDSFNASGFVVTPSASSGVDEISYLALKFTGRQVKLVDFDTPTSTGASTITGAGFTPQFALAILTNLEAVNNDPASTTDDLQSGFSICLIGSDEQWSASWRINAAEATTDVANQLAAVALMGASATDCDAIKATFTAWTNDGVTLNFSAVQGTAKKGFVLFVE